ncbi:MAG TPA: type IV pilus secretin PilQ [Candidatus Acidoferrales bacterium]|nr:type IV pilus secretin PilQ [Candidatus Acidoferrales bacterium]
MNMPVVTCRRPRLLCACLLALLTSVVHAGPTLERVEHYRRSADQLEIALILSGPAPQPQIFTTRTPSRIALDLPAVTNGLTQRSIPIGVGLTQAVQVAEAGGRTRVVIELTDLPRYGMQVQNNRVVLTLDNRKVTGVSAAAPTTPTAPTPVTAGIRSLDFRRGDQGEGLILIQLNDPKTVMDMTTQGEDTIVTLAQTHLPESLRQRLDVRDFATPVQTIEARQKGSDAVLTIRAAPDAQSMAYQTDGVLTIAMRVPAKSDQPGSALGRFGGGAPVSLNFQNVETRALLQILADVSGRNIVLSDSIGGTMALRLQNVPWDQALEIIMQARGLALREVGDTLMIAPSTEIAAFRDQQRKAEQAAPMRSEYIQINYAKAKDLAALLKSEGRNLLSAQGQVSVDERTNTLLVMETGQRLAEIRDMVSKLDVPVTQVLIEARIVVASDDFSRDLGARFGFTGFDTFEKRRGISTTSGTLEGTDTMVAGSIDSLIQNGTVLPTKIPTGEGGVPQRLNVNLPAIPAGGTPASLALAILGRDFLVDLELSALQAEGKGEILSNPRVLTANQKTASIRQGVEIPYQQSAGGSSGGTSIAFKEAVLSLQVTPQITPDNRVIMDLKVTRDNVGELVPTGSGGFVPSIDKRELNTQVLVSNGETIVLGGVYEQETNNTVNKIPLLGDIPLLGALFRQSSKGNTKRELLIFITPKIVQQGLAMTP